MELDPAARRLWPRARPDRRAALEDEARALREAHPGEADAVVVGRLAARARLEPVGAFAPGGEPSLLTVERRLAALEALRDEAPGELFDGPPVRWARASVSRESVVGYWRRWREARRAERLFVYAHVPFCRTKCGFCQFESVVGHTEERVAQTLEATCAEIADLADALGAQRADAITIGGGTPSELSAPQLEALLSAMIGPLVARDGEPYFSVELNPDSTSAPKLEVLRRHGVNRVSFGVQSMHAPTLKAIARGYQTPAMVDEALAAARAVGGMKIAVDLIASLPEETAASFRAGAASVFARRPDQVVLYAYQPVTRRGRTMDAGPLSLADAARALLELATEAGYRRVPHTGSSVIVERPDARSFEVRYVQHARAPTSVLGLGPFAESHVFGVASYVAGPDIGADAPYRARPVDPREELATYVGRRLGAAMPIDDGELTRYFGGPLADLAPETVGWLRETDALEATATGHLAPSTRDEARRAAWAFLDASAVVTLRRRAVGGVPVDRALEALRSSARASTTDGGAGRDETGRDGIGRDEIGRDEIVRDAVERDAVERVEVRAAGPLLGASGCGAVATASAAQRVEGLSVQLSVGELDPATVERWLSGWPGERATAALAGHGLIRAATAVAEPHGARLTLVLAAPAPGPLRDACPGLSVPDEGWWARATSVRFTADAVTLGWPVDPASSRLWRATRGALPDALRAALEGASIRFERGTDGEDALRFRGLDEEALRAALGPPLRGTRGRARALCLPLRGARPRLAEAALELDLAGRGLATVGAAAASRTPRKPRR